MSDDGEGENCLSFLPKFFKPHIWRIFVSFFVFTALADFIEFLGGNYVLKALIDRLGSGSASPNYGTVVLLLAIYPLVVSVSYLAQVVNRK
ncbi:MAG: hypothetical protein LBB24_03770, partial [Rickettsiales bacterium]|nr:hypothetical protein [Rickettsiales bacterium]